MSLPGEYFDDVLDETETPPKKDYLQVGMWRFEESDEGDLVVINAATRKIVTLIKK